MMRYLDPLGYVACRCRPAYLTDSSAASRDASGGMAVDVDVVLMELPMIRGHSALLIPFDDIACCLASCAGGMHCRTSIHRRDL